MDSIELTTDILRTSLQLGERADSLTSESLLAGSFPEFNSLSIVSIISCIEEETGSSISDTEITAEIFETVGTLADFIETKLD